MQDQFASLVYAARHCGFRLMSKDPARGPYVKFNPLTRIRTTVWYEGSGPTRNMHVKHDQDVEDILELNVARQNAFDGFKSDLFQTTSIPLIEHRKIMERCGKDQKTGEYDQKRFRQILNDPDYRKFKVIPGKI